MAGGGVPSDPERPSAEEDDRAPFARAWDVAMGVITASVMLVVPALGGWWFDQRFKTGVVGLSLGTLLGLAASAVWFARLVRAMEGGPRRTGSKVDEKRPR